MTFVLWRFGYCRRSLVDHLQGFGWRPLFWRIWWYSPAEARRMLERHAALWGVEPLPRESNDSLRKRILEAADPWPKRRP
jgi:hypothetical protein